MRAPRDCRRQRGFMLIEALVAILIFCLGVLGLVAMSSTAIATQSDARYRTDAAALADELASSIAFNIDRGTSSVASINAATIAASVGTFQHLPTGAPDTCAFSGDASKNSVVTDWVASLWQTGARRLPGASKTSAQIVVTPTTTAGGLNRVQITICWKAPTDVAMRRHTLVTFVN